MVTLGILNSSIYYTDYAISYYSDNGMLVMPNKLYKMTFTGWAPFTVDQFKSNIKTRYMIQHDYIKF